MKREYNKNMIIVMVVLIVIFTGMYLGSKYYFNITGNLIKEYDVDYALEHLDEVRDDYNSNMNHVPNFIKSLFGNERIEISLTRINGSVEILHVVNDKGIIKSIAKGGMGDPTLKAYLSEDTVNDILKSENQVEALRDALKNKDIDYEAVKMGTKIKIGFSRFVLGVLSVFS